MSPGVYTWLQAKSRRKIPQTVIKACGVRVGVWDKGTQDITATQTTSGTLTTGTQDKSAETLTVGTQNKSAETMTVGTQDTSVGTLTLGTQHTSFGTLTVGTHDASVGTLTGTQDITEYEVSIAASRLGLPDCDHDDSGESDYFSDFDEFE